MFHEAAPSRHSSYNNRFQPPSISESNDDPTSPTAAAKDLPLCQQPQPLHIVTGGLDLFGQSPAHYAYPSYHHQQQWQQQPQQWTDQRSSPSRWSECGNRQAMSYQRVNSVERPDTGMVFYDQADLDHDPHSGLPDPNNLDLRHDPITLNFDHDPNTPPRPLNPGKPRRQSRSSAETDRQQFAANRIGSGDSGEGAVGGEQVVTSLNVAACDDVFVDGESGARRPRDGNTRSSHSGCTRQQITSTSTVMSSTASMLSVTGSNPYNRFNHRLHSLVWCCNCLQFVFFCCLPAIHFMEQSDVEFNNDNHKSAKKLGVASTLFFLLGTIVSLAIFALLFFLVIFFTTQ